MKTIIIYKNNNSVKAFLNSEDILISQENVKFSHWGKEWMVKTVIQTKHKNNRICADYNVSNTVDNIYIAD